MMSSWASGCSIKSRSKASSCLERGDVVERVGRVGVDLERQIGDIARGPARTTSTSQPGRDLELDPPVPFGQVSVDLIEERLDARSIPRLTPERISVRVPPSILCKRLFLRAREQVPAGHLEPSPGERFPLTSR